MHAWVLNWVWSAKLLLIAGTVKLQLLPNTPEVPRVDAMHAHLLQRLFGYAYRDSTATLPVLQRIVRYQWRAAILFLSPHLRPCYVHIMCPIPAIIYHSTQRCHATRHIFSFSLFLFFFTHIFSLSIVYFPLSVCFTLLILCRCRNKPYGFLLFPGGNTGWKGLLETRINDPVAFSLFFSLSLPLIRLPN